MKAMILAAGKGERMRPLTETLPKPLLEVKGQPLIYYHLRALADLGCSEIVINTWYLADILEKYLSTIDFVKIKISREAELLNTGGGIKNALHLLGEEPFILVNGDLYTDYDFKNLRLSSPNVAHLILVDNPVYHPHGDFALISNEKLTYGNIAMIDPKMFIDTPHGAFGLGQLFRKYIGKNQVSAEHYKGLWHNLGTPEDLENANNQ